MKTLKMFYVKKKKKFRISLVVQWLRIRLLIQRHRSQGRYHAPVRHNRACSRQQEKLPQWEAQAPKLEQPPLTPTRENEREDPAQSKINSVFLIF